MKLAKFALILVATLSMSNTMADSIKEYDGGCVTTLHRIAIYGENAGTWYQVLANGGYYRNIDFNTFNEYKSSRYTETHEDKIYYGGKTRFDPETDRLKLNYEIQYQGEEGTNSLNYSIGYRLNGEIVKEKTGSMSLDSEYKYVNTSIELPGRDIKLETNCKFKK
jgi:hypothetical protein